MAYIKKIFMLCIMENKSISTFAKNFKYYRKRQGLSQYDIANMTSISQRMISHYERENILPPWDRLELLANALNVKISQLFENHSHKEEKSDNLSDIDPRSVKKLRDILSLPYEDRNDLYRILNKMMKKNQLEHQTTRKIRS